MDRVLTVLCEGAHLNGMLQMYFTREVLLGGLRRPVRVKAVSAEQSFTPFNDALIINLFDRMVPLIRKFIVSGCTNIGVFHMGDEKCSCDRSYYQDVDYVIRNYYFNQALQIPENCRCIDAVWVPNGYRFGVGPRGSETLLPFAARETLLFFAGFVGSDGGIPERVEMLNVIRENRLPAVTFTTSGFAQGMGPPAYGSMLENSRFALIPRGEAPETIRLFDALELGCIPISLEHPFLLEADAMAGAPVVRLQSWQDLPHWLTGVAAAPNFTAEFTAQQESCIAWWSAFKMGQQKRVTDLIERAFAREG